MAESGKTKKTTRGSLRAKAGLTAKAGRRRAPNIHSVTVRTASRALRRPS